VRAPALCRSVLLEASMAVGIDHVATITINAAGNISVSPDPMTTEPDRHIVFVIENNHNQKHHVGVSAFHFQKTKPSDPDDPVHKLGIHSDDVEAGDAGAFKMHVKDKDHFGSSGKYSYKYTVTASGLPDLDPQIDINN
jgi:hypothetical protein